MTREPREPMRFSQTRQRRRIASTERARAAQIDIETAIGCGRLDVERLLHCAERFRERPCGGDGGRKRWRAHGTAVDRYDVVRPIGPEAHLEHAVQTTSRMQDGAPPPLPVRIDQFADRRVDVGVTQSFYDDVTFALAIAREIPTLRMADTAHAEMRTHRRAAFRA